jgi:aminoglycoside 3-N-acetyltransferase
LSQFDYDRDDLLDAYSKLGLSSGRMVYVGSDLVKLLRYRVPGKDAMLAAHLDVMRELLGPRGTLFVPTASLNLCNTDIPFDPAVTPSSDMGIFSEYVRCQCDAIRSFHPFWSVTGIGPRAAELLNSVSRHAYGHGSIWQKFVELDVLALTIGTHPRFSVSVIHYIEAIVGVPYRYTKEFLHPVIRAKQKTVEPFYLSVLYRDCDIIRDKNRKIFGHFERVGNLRREPVGRRGYAWSFSQAEFFKVISRLMLEDIYCWLERPPVTTPYRN